MSEHQIAPEINFWEETSEEDYFNLRGMIGFKSFFTSPRGINLFTRSWLPSPSSTEDLLEKTIKVEEKKPIATRNPMRYSEKPKLGTVMDLLRVTDYLGKKIKDVSIPFVVLHGSADAVSDPEVSRELYEDAKSKDKTLKIYEGMMHSMLFGERDDNIEIVRNDIVSWLSDRCGGDKTQE
ncbi:caffeoylshikimate esterase-like [Brassica napus]|uniref:caffeoylshikimate esterase-like n=1 Tax=Brassica napus TaxID=3708 RepID=UPI0006AAFDB2|nr:caffeoylshikimate esterase-like [Brassica napus]